jgi:hypothetical protein
VRTAELIAVIGVGLAPIPNVSEGAHHPILESVKHHLAARPFGHAPFTALRGRRHLFRPGPLLHWRLAHHVPNAYIVSAPKALTVRVPHFTRNVRTPVLIAVIRVWIAVIFEVLARPFDPVAEPLALDI